MKHIISALLAGLIFGIGLTVSTMVDPERVIGFLDILGEWDPTLAFVMAGGLSVYLPAYFLWIKPKGETIFGGSLQIPTNKNIDKKLLIGASLFGLGWGLSGICPGPAITNISAGQPGILLFVLSMLVGMVLASKIVKQ